MVLSYNELKKLGINLEQKQIETKFFQLGHEVEEIENINVDKLVIGKVVEVKKHENADKLNVCKVDVRQDVLQIVCGAPNVAENMKVIVALEGATILGNKIEKVSLKGVESNGMICSLAELGFDKKNLTSEDIDGIHEVYEDVEIGSDAFLALRLKDSIFDLFITANRGDCQSYRGLYNDLMSLINYEEKSNVFKYNVEIEKDFEDTIDNEFKLEIEDGSVLFKTRYIKDVNIQNSIWSRKAFLLKHGFKSQNSITDISNEALLKYGIPSHIYDADKVLGKLKVVKLDQEEKFIGLDENEKMLSKGTLVIRDEEKIVCVAGVMGSYETRVTNATKNVLVEVASFDSKEVFNSAKQLGKKTESALRYEKNIDLTITDNVMNFICNSIKEENNSCSISKEVAFGSAEIIREEIKLEYTTLRNILGIDLPNEDIISILKKLDFTVSENADYLLAKAPAYRYDIYGENDLIEEIVRVYNIDKIEMDDSLVLFSNIDRIIPNKTYDILRNIENTLLKNSLNQVVTYSLVNEKMLTSFGGMVEESVRLMHPLSKENEYYRQSLIPSLIKICKENYAYQEKSVEFFEIARTYKKVGEEICEENKLSIILSGDFSNYYMGNKRKYNFFDLKEKIENLLVYLGVEYEFKASNDIAELNPYAQANMYIDGNLEGFIGEVVFDYDKKIKESLYVFELKLDNILDKIENNSVSKYEKISFYPKITRDLSLEVAKDMPYEKVVELFDDIDYLKDVLLLDIYTGEHIKDDKKSMTFRLTFQDVNDTLTGEQIDKQMEKIFKKSEEKGYIIYGK